MILAEDLKTLSTFTAPALSRAIQLAGYRGDTFTRAEFLGLTNGNQFCYKAVYVEHGEECTTKVFLTYDPAEGRVSADY